MDAALGVLFYLVIQRCIELIRKFFIEPYAKAHDKDLAEKFALSCETIIVMAVVVVILKCK
jgi:hypothetical protein